MRIIRLRLFSTAAVLAVTLAACGSNGTTTSDATGTVRGVESVSETTSVGGAEALADVSLTPGEADAAPTVNLPSTPFSVSEPALRVVIEGTGRPIGPEDTVTTQYVLVNGRDGKQRASMWGTNRASVPIARMPELSGLIGIKLGSTVLVAMPAAHAFRGEGDEKLDIDVEDTLIYVFEPVSATATPLTEATGEVVPPKPGLPTVKMGATPADPATFAVPKGNPPSDTVAQLLVRGEGPKVTPGQTIRVTYTGVTWRDPKTPFDYSGRGNPAHLEFQIGMSDVIKAWDEKLVGQPVGSRVLLVAPPKDAYGDAGQGVIKPGDTLVFVVDILDAH